MFTRTSLFLVAQLVLVVGALERAEGATPTAADERLDRLSPEHRDWITRQVLYIIGDIEEEVFLTLETIEEREHFIDSFWRKRDPNPATPDNEFRDEHYRRLEHADKILGRETFRDGYRTDRGRYYIILGEPRETKRFAGYNQIVSSELWFYQGEAGKGLPAFFYLLFFKRSDIGEYRLYSPAADGPTALMPGSFSPNAGPMQAIETLLQISPELARASLTVDTSESADFQTGRPSLGAAMTVARIEQSPLRAVRTDYANAWLNYKDMVSTEYSFNFVPSRSNFAVLIGADRTAMVQLHVEIEPQHFSLATDESQSRFYTTLEVSIDVRDADSRQVVAIDKEVFVELSPSEMTQVQSSPFAYQDSFPLVPGDYETTVIVRNAAVKHYTVASTSLQILAFQPGQPAIAPPALGYRIETLPTADPDQVRTYQVGGTKIYPAAQQTFVIGEPLHYVLPLHDVPEDHGLLVEIADEQGELFDSRRVSMAEHRGRVFSDVFVLDELVGGSYLLRARLLDSLGEEVAVSSAPFTVSPRSDIARASLVVRRGFNSGVPGLLSLAKGDQHWNRGERELARRSFEEAVAAENTDLPQARWKLAQSFLTERRADEAIALLEPIAEAHATRYEVMAGLGFGYYFKADCPVATKFFEKAAAIRRPDSLLHNGLGDCYEKSGNFDKARAQYQRSLALDPEQDPIRARLDALSRD